MDYLKEKKKEFHRTRFVKNLEELIQTLVLRSDVYSQYQRKKGIVTITELLNLFIENVMYNSLDRIKEYGIYKQITFNTLERIKLFS